MISTFALSVGCLLNKRLQVFYIFINRTSKPRTTFASGGEQSCEILGVVWLQCGKQLLINYPCSSAGSEKEFQFILSFFAPLFNMHLCSVSTS